MSGLKRSTRIDLRRTATLVNSDGESMPVTILDISRDGFRVALSEPLKVGERVTIIDGKEKVSGQIRWTLGNEAGGAFVE